MVVFTCNHCGDSLQKPKVAKHYQFQCRKYPDLTCVDCHKDFRGEEFVEHTQCFTENQRYGGKDYVEKPSANKGLRKQNEWMNVVQNVLTNDATLTYPERKFLTSIVHNQNIPRKKAKFLNFIRSSFGNRIDWTVVETVWDKMESSLKQTKEANKNVDEKEEKPADTQNDNTENAETENGNDENTVKDDHENTANGTTEKKKSKKKKIEETSDEKTAADDSVVKDSENKVEKKKSKKKKVENGTVDVLAVADIDVSMDNAENSTAENQNNENIVRENGNEESTKYEENGKKKKSKKRKLPTESKNSADVTKDENAAQDDTQEVTSEKTLKKRKIESTEEKAEEKMETDEKQITTSCLTTNKKAKKNANNFDWKQAINEIMTKKNRDGKLSVKKLQRKVVTRYLKLHSEAMKADAVSKFDKILKKMKNYNIEDDIVHIITS